MDRLRVHLGGRTELAESNVEVGDETYRIVHPASAEALIDEEDFARGERLPYWAELWPSARVLAQKVAGRPIRRLRVLELG